MTTTVTAYAAPSAGAPFERTTLERRDLLAHDVLIDIAFAGICHSDIHTVRDEWGQASYPLTPGHEIAGTVSAVGPEVTRYAVGDRVGVGCMVDSCRRCDNCRAGDENYCTGSGMVGTYGAEHLGEITQGGYSQKIVVDENYVLAIPEGIELDVAAPLLCAGVTLFEPLTRFGAGPGSKVAVIGLGGLGHMGVQLAHAMGCEVTVLSQSLKKQEDGLRLGADHYVATSDEGALDELAGSFDLILNTVSANLVIEDYLRLLKPLGTLVALGAPSEPMSVSAFSLLQGGRTFAGSMIGGIRRTQEMLDFCAEHRIGAEVEVIGPDQIDEAYERAVNSDVRYRFVIDIAQMA